MKEVPSPTISHAYLPKSNHLSYTPTISHMPISTLRSNNLSHAYVQPSLTAHVQPSLTCRGSLMKKMGVLLPTQSQFPSSVYILTANPRGSRAVSALPDSPPVLREGENFEHYCMVTEVHLRSLATRNSTSWYSDP